MRLKRYALPVPDQIAAYLRSVYPLPAVQSWVQTALAQQDFVPFGEPDRTQRG